MALSLKVARISQPDKPTMDAAGNFSGHVSPAPLIIEGVVVDGFERRRVSFECDDSSVLSEWATGSATTVLDAWIQAWVDANLVDGEIVGAVRTDAGLTASQQSYLGTTLTPS